jgi:hypothetical protein
VKLSHASLLFAGLAALSLSGKLLANRMEPAPDAGLLDARLAGLLRAGGYRVAPESHGFAILLRGQRPGCTILAGDYDPHGTFDETFRQISARIGPLRFAYRGRSAASAPKLRPLLDFYVRRELRRVGMTPARMPIIAYAASPGCGADRLAWSQLAVLPR